MFGNGLRAHVDKAGRLISVQGAPVAGLASLARRAPVRPDRPRRRDPHGGGRCPARRSPTCAPAPAPTRVWFLAPGGLRPGWLTYTEPGSASAYEHVIDAANGATLYRRSTVNFDGPATPSSTRTTRAPAVLVGRPAHHVNLIKRGFLLPNANFPKGKYATVWPDLNDDDQRQNRETTRLPRPARRRDGCG